MPQQVTLPYICAAGSPAFPPSTGSLAGRCYGWLGYATGHGELHPGHQHAHLRLRDASLPRAAARRTTEVQERRARAASPTPTTRPPVSCRSAPIVGRWSVTACAPTASFLPTSSAGEQFGLRILTVRSSSRRAPGSRAPGATGPILPGRALVPSRSRSARTAPTPSTTRSATETSAKRLLRQLRGSTKPGQVVFKARARSAQIGTLAAACAKLGKPRPASLGFWLILSGPNGKRPDGNLL